MTRFYQTSIFRAPLDCDIVADERRLLIEDEQRDGMGQGVGELPEAIFVKSLTRQERRLMDRVAAMVRVSERKWRK